MKKSLLFIANAVMRGLLVVIPIYLSVLLLLKAIASVALVVRPISQLVPQWFPAQWMLSFFLVLLISFLIGVGVRTRLGEAVAQKMEKTFFERIPGYGILRSLTHQVAGDDCERVWQSALAEIEEALVPAYIIEELDDGRFTVFVPLVPTPLAGAVYILQPGPVHLLDVSFTQSLRVISSWGSGANGLVGAMEKRPPGV